MLLILSSKVLIVLFGMRVWVLWFSSCSVDVVDSGSVNVFMIFCTSGQILYATAESHSQGCVGKLLHSLPAKRLAM